MAKGSISDYTALELGGMIRRRELGCEEATAHYIRRAQAQNPRLNSCISMVGDAMDRARAVQRRLDAGEELSPLAGVPMAVKDNICTRGVLTTCGSRMLAGFRPSYDATAYAKLLAAGAVPIAKTNMDEFAMGGSTETSYFGPTRNPWDCGRVPGGSSGGTAAAVASGQAAYGLGSDTGGSIRQPSAFCGITGLKPTYGSVSRYGLVAYASSMDQVGPMAGDALDCAAILELMQGRDALDSTTLDNGHSDAARLDMADIRRADIRGLRLGIPDNYFSAGLDADICAAILSAADELQRAGARLQRISLPTEYAVPAYYVIACAEAGSNLSRYDGLKYGYSPGDDAGLDGVNTSEAGLDGLYIRARSQGFGMEVKRRLMIGAYVLSAGYYEEYYRRASQARRLIAEGFQQAFRQCDAILSPVTPTTAYRLGENISDPMKMYLGDVYTVSANLAGLPAVALPCGFSDGLPVGMQLIGRHFDEQTILRLAHRYQLMSDYHRARPAGTMP